jgi:probable phosphoglycerate mutase
MTTLYLVRHGHTATLGRQLVGRRPDVPLDDLGRSQVLALAEHMAKLPLRAVYTSPLARTLATARAVAQPHGLDVIVREPLADMEFGEWSGRPIDELRGDPTFHAFNAHRAGVAPPGGEHPAAAQSRMLAELCRLRDAHPNEAIAVVGHGDPLRSALAGFVGMPLDLARRLELAPASVTRLDLSRGDATLCFLNLIPDGVSAAG